jgi:hypothetical protein
VSTSDLAEQLLASKDGVVIQAYCVMFVSLVGFQVLTAASMKLRFVFWDILPCKIIVDLRFRSTCCLHHQGGSHVPLKRRSTIILHGSTSQKTNLNFTSLIRIFTTLDVDIGSV